MSDDDNKDKTVIPITRGLKHNVTFGEMPAAIKLPDGRYTVLITFDGETLYEVNFTDASGDLPRDAPILSTVGAAPLIVNLLTGAIRAIAGTRD